MVRVMVVSISPDIYFGNLVFAKFQLNPSSDDTRSIFQGHYRYLSLSCANDESNFTSIPSDV